MIWSNENCFDCLDAEYARLGIDSNATSDMLDFLNLLEYNSRYVYGFDSRHSKNYRN